jgi:hypothetical protein
MKIKSLLTIAVALVFTSCTNDRIYETSHPDEGKITFTTDFSQRMTGIDIPATITAKVGQYSATLSTDKVVEFPNLIEPETYHINIYNTADRITVNGTTATADYGTSTSLPGWFFTWAKDVAIEEDKEYDIVATMQQQVRQLTLVIEPTGGTIDKITAIDAILTGVASQLNIDDNTHSVPVSVKPVFAKETDGKYAATVYLLGIVGTDQKLTTTMAFAGSDPVSITETHDLATLLANFNADKKKPLILGGTIVETPTEVGFTSTINGWSPVVGTGIAD